MKPFVVLRLTPNVLDSSNRVEKCNCKFQKASEIHVYYFLTGFKDLMTIDLVERNDLEVFSD